MWIIKLNNCLCKIDWNFITTGGLLSQPAREFLLYCHAIIWNQLMGIEIQDIDRLRDVPADRNPSGRFTREVTQDWLFA